MSENLKDRIVSEIKGLAEYLGLGDVITDDFVSGLSSTTNCEDVDYPRDSVKPVPKKAKWASKTRYDKLPDKVMFNDKKKATTLFFGDEVHHVKATKNDDYSRTFGFLMAYFQHHSGMSRNKANKYLENIVAEKE
jgi:hypothetical protein